MGKTAEKLAGSFRGAGELLGQMLFPRTAGESELKAWAESLI